MIRSQHFFASSIYPRPAIEIAAKAFAGISQTELQATDNGILAEVSSPVDGGENIAHEFCNVALIAAIEMHLEKVA